MMFLARIARPTISLSPAPPDLAHALGPLALPAADRLVADPLPLLEAPKPLALYAGVVHKEVLAALVGGDFTVLLATSQNAHEAKFAEFTFHPLR
jgi:hypothetical protein